MLTLLYLALLVTLGNGAEVTCMQTLPTKVTYNYTSQLLTVSLGQNLTEVNTIDMYLCKNGIFHKFLSETCSAIDITLSPQIFNELIIISFPPVCTGSPPPLDYSIHMAIDFSLSATIPSSPLQQLQVSGTCLESTVFTNSQYPFSNIQICLSANSKSIYINYYDENFILLQYEQGTLQICFISSEEIRSVVGDVKEVFIQEVGVVNPNDLCADPESFEDEYVLVFGSKGILPLVSNGEDFLPDNVCSLEESAISSTFSPPASLLLPQTMSSISRATSPTMFSVSVKQTQSMIAPIPSFIHHGGAQQALGDVLIIITLAVVTFML